MSDIGLTTANFVIYCSVSVSVAFCVHSVPLICFQVTNFLYYKAAQSFVIQDLSKKNNSLSNCFLLSISKLYSGEAITAFSVITFMISNCFLKRNSGFHLKLNISKTI